jgi:hypothetical protein
MFTRADQLLVERTEDTFPLHALEFHWDEFEPHLECFDIIQKEVAEFDLEDVNFAVSRKRICVGFWERDSYVPCPKQTPVDRFGQCAECAGESFIPFQDCIFEPRCDGEICDLDFCRREHVLYVAFYDTRMKIGMSSARRVDRRLIEQGADAFSVIGTFATRKKARDSEKDISSRLRIPQSHRQETLVRSLSRPVDERGIEGRFDALKITLGEAYGLKPEPLKWLKSYPIDLPLREVPRLEEPWGSHKGEFVGIKGRWLVFESDGLKALSLADLPSRFLTRAIT